MERKESLGFERFYAPLGATRWRDSMDKRKGTDRVIGALPAVASPCCLRSQVQQDASPMDESASTPSPTSPSSSIAAVVVGCGSPPPPSAGVCGDSAAPGLSAMGTGTGDHSIHDGDRASASRKARGEQRERPTQLAKSSWAGDGLAAPRPAKSARSRRHGRDQGPKTAARAPCGRMCVASLYPSPPRAAAKGAAFRASGTHTPFTAARGKRGNTPKTQMAGGPGAGRSTGTDHARQRARSGGVTRTLELRHELRRALSRVGTSELDRGGCVGRRRVAPPSRQPASHAVAAGATPPSPEWRSGGGS
jgi:hypothetical protein